MRLLVVDDSSTMRRIIINTLNELGYQEIVEASNAAKDDIVEALRAGVNNYIVKLFTPETFRAKIEAVTAAHPLPVPDGRQRDLRRADSHA